MFLEKSRTRIIQEFEEFCRDLPKPAEEIQKKLEALDEDTALVMKFYYANMPYSDVYNYSFSTYLDFAQHGVYLWNHFSYCREMPEDIFLGDVLHYRINEEEIKPCRKVFCEKISQRIQGMTMEQAALEVNYWCAEEMTYQSTDERTSSAWDSYVKGFGRCGEESVFGVNALRSVGIPARQVYVPRWAHCDDNHAWVEVWCDGEWHYLGACEPEAVLDRGWFTSASSRAMMVHSRSFYAGSDAADTERTEDIAVIRNQLARYANTKRITIRVEDLDGCPVEGARVKAEVLNYSEFSPIAERVTGPDGSAELETGFGSLHILAAFQGELGECFINANTEDSCCCVLGEEKAEETWVEFDMTAPLDSVKNPQIVTREQEAENNRRFTEASEKRKRKTEAFRPAWMDSFLADQPEKAEKYMSVLSEKDRQDADSDVLMEHYEESEVYKNQYPEEIFLHYVWNPRIEFEVLTKWRRTILEYFSAEQKKAFRENPKEIWNWIETNMKSRPERERRTIYTAPSSALKLGYAEMRSRRVLFTAIARTLGVPARINEVDSSMEYWENGTFVRVLKECEKDAYLTLTGEEKVTWSYFQNWSLAKLSEDGYHSLGLWDARMEQGSLKLNLEPGEYRLVTANRLPTGNIFGKYYDFQLTRGEHKEICLELRKACLADMLQTHTIPDYNLMDGEGQAHSVGELTEKGRKILFWLEVSKEPTEHILNELMEMQEEFIPCQDQLLFIVRTPEDLSDPTFSKCRKILPQVQILYDTFGKDLEMTARRMYVAPDKLPLLVVTDGPATGLFAASGYSVGMADMLMRVLKS